MNQNLHESNKIRVELQNLHNYEQQHLEDQKIKRDSSRLSSMPPALPSIHSAVSIEKKKESTKTTIQEDLYFKTGGKKTAML